MNRKTLSKRARFWSGALLSVPRNPIVLPRMLSSRRAPLIALAVIMAFSLGARLYDLKRPCYGPCTTPFTQLIFDENYYVNAARAIDGIPQPLSSPYARVTSQRGQVKVLSPPSGDDPNADHPQLAKLLIAGGIEVFGDNPWGWRLGTVLFSLIAMGAMYALVTGVGGSPWLAAGTVAVMALDNLMLVHGRIAMLDIYALAMMLLAGAFYVRRRPLLAGAALGVGACMKEVAFYLLVALVLFEVARLAQSRWGGASSRVIPEGPRVAIRGLVACALCTFATFFALLWVLDLLVPTETGSSNPFVHFAHIVHDAASLTTTPSNPARVRLSQGHGQVPGASLYSTPLQWLINQKVIDYSKQTAVGLPPPPTVSLGSGQAVSQKVEVLFRGEINPFVIFLALPALMLAIGQAWRTRNRVALLGAAWGVGLFLPLLLQSEIVHRRSYLFYMLIVLPGIYLMTARLFSWRYVPRLATVVWAGLLIFGFVHLYPIRDLL